MQKNLTDLRSCLLCTTGATFWERLGAAGTSDLGSLSCFGNVQLSLVLNFFSQTLSFAFNSATEFLELFSGSILTSTTSSLPTTDSIISSLAPSCYLLWVTVLHRDHGGGREQGERWGRTYHSWNYRSFQFGRGWLDQLLSPQEWSPGGWFKP